MAQKEYDFLVTLKTNIVTIVNLISLLLLIIAIGVFFYTGFRILPYSTHQAWIAFIVAFLIFVWIMIRILANKKPYYRLALLLAGAYFFFPPLNFIWVGLLYVVAGLMEKPAKVPQELGFSKDGITPNSIISKHYNWNELTNVLIKNNLLTIDFKNNKLFQKELQNPVDKETEIEFNAFCKECLKNSSEK